MLFPGNLLPLHVFEARYREMISDCLRGERQLAIPLLRPGYEEDYEAQPPVCEIMGVGKIIMDEILEGGRYHILVLGTQRVRLVSESLHSGGYRVGELEVVEDLDEEVSSDLDAMLRQLVDGLAGDMPALGEAVELLQEGISGPLELADLVAGQLVPNPLTRQQILETISPISRVEKVIAQLMELQPGAGGANNFVH